MIERIEAVRPGKFTFSHNNEDGDDYIYLAEKLRTLSGKKLQSKRNLVNRFKTAYEGRWNYEDMTRENIKDAFAFHIHWCNLNGCARERDFEGETCAIVQALHNFDYLNLRGGLLRLDGEVIAFTFGCKATPDMFVVQIEKADHTIQGAYQMINQQFVQRNCNDVEYVNREEDLGLEGLRKAKKSYYPAMRGVKYVATPKEEIFLPFAPSGKPVFRMRAASTTTSSRTSIKRNIRCCISRVKRSWRWCRCSRTA